MAEKILKINTNGKLLLKGNVALINGASAGIGRVITQTLLENGIFVIATYYQRKEVVDSLIKKYGKDKIIAFQVDFLSDDYENKIEKIVKEAKEWRKKIDFLINVSGVWLVKPFLYEEDKGRRWLWRINYEASYTFIQKIIPYMIGNGGQIINIASTAGVKGTGQQATYCASKAALINLTQSLAEEFAALNIKVNSISPGPTETSALDKYVDEKAKSLLIKNIPINKLCKPIDVANAVLAILMNEYMTGTNILVHGGRI